MHVRSSVLPRLALAAIVSSCSLPSASDDDSYYALRAQITTGSEGTDGDVSLCWTVDAKQTCKDLSSSRDDFESGRKNTFDVSLSPRVAHGTPFTAIALQYSAGLSIGDSWQVVGFRLSRYSGDKNEEVICDATFDQTVSGIETIRPPGCP